MLRLRKPPTSQETFEDLIQVHLDGLYGAALRYPRQPQATEDLVHDTVARLAGGAAGAAVRLRGRIGDEG